MNKLQAQLGKATRTPKGHVARGVHQHTGNRGRASRQEASRKVEVRQAFKSQQMPGVTDCASHPHHAYSWAQPPPTADKALWFLEGYV